MLKNIVKKSLASVGYELYPMGENRVRFEPFQNLVRAYEGRLNEIENVITDNELRPRLLARLLGTPPSEAYAIIQGLARTRDLPGDVCEFGVAQGETSALIANEIGAGRKRLHLFDSFEGLPKPTEKDRLKDDIFSLGSMEAYAGTMSSPEDLVRGRLQALSFSPARFTIHKGFIDKVLATAKDLPRQVSFAYVDFDFYEPIRQALDFLHKVTAVGAVLVVDDYDFFSTGAKLAVDEFVAAHNTSATIYSCMVPESRYGHFAVLSRVR